MTHMRKLLAAAAALCLSGALGFYPLGAAVPAETVTLNPSVRHQTMRGWGGTFSFLRSLNYMSQPTLDQIVDESVDDLGLTFLRILYGMLQEPFNDNGNPRSINFAGFHDAETIDRDVARGMGPSTSACWQMVTRRPTFSTRTGSTRRQAG